MKKQLLLYITTFIGLFAMGQEQKVEIVPDSLFYPRPQRHESIVLICRIEGVEITSVPFGYYLPFKVYQINNPTENWNTTQDLYNTIQAQVPNIRVFNTSNPNATPKIQMRGDDNTIVIVDGVRYDASILNTINPANIESVKVSNSLSAVNYFLSQ